VPTLTPTEDVMIGEHYNVGPLKHHPVQEEQESGMKLIQDRLSRCESVQK